MKRALIIGTSHSEASCRRSADTDIELITAPHRWHDYLKDYGYEVTNLSSAGATVQHQFSMIWSYIQDHPDAFWDLVIIEGRTPEAHVSLPMARAKGYPDDRTPELHEIDHIDMYRFWMDGQPKKIRHYPFIGGNVAHYISTLKEPPVELINMTTWFTEYVHSYLHSVDNWTCNYALCKYMERFATQVKWFTNSVSDDLSGVDDWRTQIGKDLMAEYVIPETWPELKKRIRSFIELQLELDIKLDLFCDCGHYNEAGHRVVWQYLEKQLKKEGIL